MWSRLATAPIGLRLQRQVNLSETSVLAVVDKVLDQKGIAFSTEVTMKIEAVGASGPISVTRRFDRVFQDPISGEWVMLEAKGPNPQSLTDAQKLVDKVLQEKGGHFEVLETGGKPPGSAKVRGIAFTKGFKGTISPGSLHHVSGNMSTSVAAAAANEVNSLNVVAWREGMNARHADAPAVPGEVRYTKPNQPPAKLTQGQVPGVTPPAKKPAPSLGDMPLPKKPPTRPGATTFDVDEPGGKPPRGPAGGKPFNRVLEQTKPMPQTPVAPEPTPGSPPAEPTAGAGAPKAVGTPVSPEPPPGALPKGSGTPGSPEPTPGAVPKGSGTPGSPEPTPGAVPKGSGTPAPSRAAKIGVGALKMFGPAILDAVNRYFMAKAEAERATKLIQTTLDGPEVQESVRKLIEKERLDIARKQLRNVQVYATASVVVAFTNDVIDRVAFTGVALGESDQTSIMSSVMSHDGLTGATGSKWWVSSSLPVADVELSPPEANQLKLELAEEQGGAPITYNDEALAKLNAARNQALADQPKLEKAEQRAKEEEIDRAGVLADARKREQQQAEINERLRRLAAQQQKAAPAKPPAATQQPPAAPALLPPPTPVVQAPTLLPGAPGPSPIAQAAAVVQEAKAWAAQLTASGTALANRLGTANSPSQQERQTWLDQEQSWRLSVKTAMNKLTSMSRGEAVSALAEMIETSGGKLKEIRTLLGG